MRGAAPSLDVVAGAAGLARHWTDVAGRPRRVDDDVLLEVLHALQLPAQTPRERTDSLARLQQTREQPPLVTAQVGGRVSTGHADVPHVWCDEEGLEHVVHGDADGSVQAPAAPGYWRLRVAGGERPVAVAPLQCWSVQQACADPLAAAWGVSLQVYSTRCGDGGIDGGIGDASGCLPWLQRVAALGGHALALSPMHAGGVAGGRYSPYSPDDRRFLDPLQASPLLMFGDAARTVLDDAPALRAALQGLQQIPLIDWPAASASKWEWLALVHDRVVPALPLWRDALQSFVDGADPALQAYAAHAAAADGRSQGLHLFGQWLASTCWNGLQEQARSAGLSIGLIADQAVGFDPQGHEAAAAGAAALRGLELGAPPDAFNAAGQAWGITGYAPNGLVDAGFAPYISLLRAAMHGRGGIRIDHVLGLMRMWVLPSGAGAGNGVYLSCPLEDLLNLVALESWRHRCVVIGEDLGVVPAGLRTLLARRGVLGLDVLQFTRGRDGQFLPPSQWRPQAVATTTTHDLPTTAGWLAGNDIAWRERLRLAAPREVRRQRQERAADASRLETALRTQGWRGGVDPRGAAGYIGASACALALLPAEDALALQEQPNLPGTVDVHPNWRRRLPQGAPTAEADAVLQTLAQARTRTPIPMGSP